MAGRSVPVAGFFTGELALRTFLTVLALFAAQANGQVIDNPFTSSAETPAQNQASKQAQPSQKVITKSMASNAEKAGDAKPTKKPKQYRTRTSADKALDEFYRYQDDIVERGRIYAKTADDWTDIRIVESNLDKARSHFKAADRHWAAGRNDEWMREMSQVHDVLRRALPQVQRIDGMIRANGGLSPHRNRSLKD